MRTFNLYLKTDDEQYGTFHKFVEETMNTKFPEYIDAKSLWGYVKGKHQDWFPIGVTGNGIEVDKIGHQIVGFYTSKDDVNEVNRIIGELLKLDPFFTSMRDITFIKRLNTALETSTNEEIAEETGINIKKIKEMRNEKKAAYKEYYDPIGLPSSFLVRFINYFEPANEGKIDRVKEIVEKSLMI